MTAAALAILVDEGKLHWDDRVIDYLPWLRLWDPWVTRELRIRDLLCHRNGLPPYGGDITIWGSTHTRREDLERLRSLEPATSFRSAYAYENNMFIAAGEVVEAVTGKRWDDFVRERLFAPLGMTRTTTSFAVATGDSDVTTPHIRQDGVVRPIAWRNVENLGAAAAVNSDVADMARWIRLQLRHGAWTGGRIFSEAASHEMWSPQTVIPLAPDSLQPRPIAMFAAYGLGWSIRDYRGRKLVTHGGWTDGMLSRVALIPAEHLGVVVLTNIHNRDLGPALALRIIDAYLGGSAVDWSAYYLRRVRDGEARDSAAEARLEQARVPGTHPSLPLPAYAGLYHNDVYGEVRISADGGRLSIRMLASPTFVATLEHWHYDTFRPRWEDPVLESHLVPFTIDATGTVRSFTLTLGDFIDPATYPFTRMEP
jgi:CubicO group peptidase (beta-lactamase class C family)